MRRLGTTNSIVSLLGQADEVIELSGRISPTGPLTMSA